MQRKGSVINEICLLYDRLSDTEKLIADFVMAYQGEIPSLTTREIAARSQTSAATVSRFVRHLGYESFSELRSAMQRDNGTHDPDEVPRNVISLDAPRAAMETVLLAKNRELLDTLNLISDQDLTYAVRLIEEADSVVFGAVGNTVPAALSASFLIAQLGIRSHCAPTTEAMVLSSMSLTKRDVFVFMSKYSLCNLIHRHIKFTSYAYCRKCIVHIMFTRNIYFNRIFAAVNNCGEFNSVKSVIFNILCVNIIFGICYTVIYYLVFTHTLCF